MRYDLRGRFIGPAGRRLFLLTIAPKPQAVSSAVVLAIQPFGDELNKTRRSLSCLGRLLARNGWMLAIPDLQGTGDSEGELSLVRMDDWISDIIATCHYLRREENCQKVGLIGVRLGSLIALQQRVLEMVRPDLVVLWEPITNGRHAMRQFLRLRVAADRFLGLPTSVGSLIATARVQGVLEVAGYELSGAFIQDLLDSTVDIAPVAERIPLHVLSISKPALQRVKAPSSMRSRIHATEVSGIRFWESVEISLADEFIKQTVDRFPSLG